MIRDVSTSLDMTETPSRWSDFSQLVKARLTLLVLVTTGVGFYFGRTPFDLAGFFHVLIGAALAAAGASALNQWWERDLDALMSRTRERPVPAGRMRAHNALMLGCALSAAGVIYLATTTNLLASFLAALTIIIYVLGYTPLKRVTNTNTLIGAIPGALPPLIGWAAARGSLDFAAWTLFAILFIWQMPHFFAIAWICRHDYECAGFRMLSRDDESGVRSASQAVLFCIGLLLIGGIPAFIGMAHPLYLVAELTLGGAFTALALRFHAAGNLRNARLLFLGSIIYLPLLLGALMMTKT
ncbi:MAG: protoheme IX farnesyltransferase [Chthoniobacterales bacterium]|nr:MAG: protoheme IX farnesyltransferase [Chthoniobacterales bacterium]